MESLLHPPPSRPHLPSTLPFQLLSSRWILLGGGAILHGALLVLPWQRSGVEWREAGKVQRQPLDSVETDRQNGEESWRRASKEEDGDFFSRRNLWPWLEREKRWVGEIRLWGPWNPRNAYILEQPFKTRNAYKVERREYQFYSFCLLSSLLVRLPVS
jgi:hypothetical protein